jgi:hypothetical protein
MIKDPRQYTHEYPGSNILIKQALAVLNNQSGFNELMILIDAVLKNENDALINVALNLSPSFTVSNIIWKALNATINSVPETLDAAQLKSRQGRQQIIGSRQDFLPLALNNPVITANVFAIPLVLVAGSKVKTKLAGNLNVNKLNDYFIQNKIFIDETNCFISGKLVDQLSLAKIKPSQLYYWSRNLKNANLWLPIELEGTPVPVLNEGVFLRFLIGVSTVNSQSQIGNTLPLNQEAYRNSSMGLMELIGKELKNEAITLFPIPFTPVNLSEAYTVGDNKRKEIAVAVALSNIVRKMREQNLIPVAKISGINEALQISITNNTDATLSETSVWHLTKFEDYEEHLATITNLLRDMQVEYSYVS